MANGWTEERRARQAKLIRSWKPWEWSTGPNTEEGKERSAHNAIKHGMRSAEWTTYQKQVNTLMREYLDIVKIS